MTPTTDLVRDGERPEDALRRIERSPDCVRILESDAGQSLLRELARRARVARREVVTA